MTVYIILATIAVGMPAAAWFALHLERREQLERRKK